jgi:phage shock protein A
LTAVAALGLLRGALEEGDRTLAREALEAAQETTQDLTRQAEITRVLTAL